METLQPKRNKRPKQSRAMELIREGKVKKVYAIDENTLEFAFTDQISVFDKVIPTQIPGKGESLCRTSAYWFQRAEEMGFKTDFLGTPSPQRMRVRRVKIEPDYDKIKSMKGGYLIPLEFIARYYLAGSLFDKVKKGSVPAKELGFASKEEAIYGARLPEPIFEVTTKLEEHDRKISFEEGCRIANISMEELREVERTVFSIDEMIEEEVSQRGLVHVDGKKEFGLTDEREVMLVDTFATADEDRFWDKDPSGKGMPKEMSKEVVRQYYRETGYHQKLMDAREKGLQEPEIPPLPPEMVEKVSDLYKEMYERLTGRAF